MTTRATDLLLPQGIHASRPASAAKGALYSCTTHSLVYQWDGAAWQTWATLGSSGGSTGETTWTTPTMTNSWVAYGAPYAAAGFRKDASGAVRLRGLIKSGTINTAAFTLPTGYRPPFKITIPTFNATNPSALVSVTSAGQVIPETGSNVNVSLDGITFYTD